MKWINIIRIVLITCIVISFGMLYVNFNSDLPKWFYLWRNPDFRMNTVITFTISYIFGIIVNSILLYLTYKNPENF